MIVATCMKFNRNLDLRLAYNNCGCALALLYCLTRYGRLSSETHFRKVNLENLSKKTSKQNAEKNMEGDLLQLHCDNLFCM